MTTAKNPAKPTGGNAVRLTATLPKPEHLGVNPEELLDDPRTTRTAVITYDVARVIDDLDTGTDTAVIRVLTLETLTGPEAATATQLAAAAATARTGATVLPFDRDDDDADD